MNRFGDLMDAFFLRGSGWLAFALMAGAWVWGRMGRGLGEKPRGPWARWLGLAGAFVACIHGLTSLGTRFEWDLGHLWVQSYLRLGWFAWLWLLLLAGISLSPVPWRRALPWHGILRSCLGVLLLLILGHALLAPFSSVTFVRSMAGLVVGLQIWMVASARWMAAPPRSDD